MNVPAHPRAILGILRLRPVWLRLPVLVSLVFLAVSLWVQDFIGTAFQPYVGNWSGTIPNATVPEAFDVPLMTAEVNGAFSIAQTANAAFPNTVMFRIRREHEIKDAGPAFLLGRGGRSFFLLPGPIPERRLKAGCRQVFEALPEKLLRVEHPAIVADRSISFRMKSSRSLACSSLGSSPISAAKYFLSGWIASPRSWSVSSMAIR